MQVTKTLELKLHNPNTHKRNKLRETYREYQKALNDAFNQDCSTQNETNGVVVNYDLSGYSKNALKKYVPQLTDKDTYNAKNLKEDHPVRFTNEGPKIDHKPQNQIEWYIKVPHHNDYNLWCPVTLNPEQRSWMEALYNKDAELGETRMFPRGGDWMLHITVHRDIEEQSVSGSVTPVGVDIGETALATVCHLDECGSPTTPKIYSEEGSKVRELREKYFSISKRLQERGSKKLVKEIGDKIWRQIDDIIHTVTRRVVEYADEIDNPVVVLENLTYIRENMDYGNYMNRRLHGWAFAKIHSQITYKAREKGIPVRTVNPRGTSKNCHVCGETGYRPYQATFQCTNKDCWVSEYQADINGATNIAKRYLHGENSQQKSSCNDSVEDGAELTQPQDNSKTEAKAVLSRGANDNAQSSKPKLVASTGTGQMTLEPYTS
ncbi:MAG: RNA-guided endonuclease InsQ/TnpB family protein [Halobacteria archaeon]